MNKAVWNWHKHRPWRALHFQTLWWAWCIRLGHALGAVAHLPHGLCMNLFLPYVLEYNKDVNADKIARATVTVGRRQTSMHKPLHIYVPIKPFATILAIRDRLFTLTKLPRTLQ